jgi:hypothetical protein
MAVNLAHPLCYSYPRGHGSAGNQSISRPVSHSLNRLSLDLVPLEQA